MDKLRKDIVLKEIKYWKEHHLLPEHYCDFLLSLYTEGSEAEQQIYEQKGSSLKKFIYYLIHLYLILQLVFTLVVIYFTETSIDLQITLFTVFVIISFSCGVYFKKSKQLSFHIALIVGVLILFLSSVHMVSNIFAGGQIGLIGVILINCLLWILLGFRLNLKYLIISGITSALLLVTYTFI